MHIESEFDEHFLISAYMNFICFPKYINLQFSIGVNSFCSAVSNNTKLIGTCFKYAVICSILYVKKTKKISMYQLQALFYTILGPSEARSNGQSILPCISNPPTWPTPTDFPFSAAIKVQTRDIAMTE